MYVTVATLQYWQQYDKRPYDHINVSTIENSKFQSDAYAATYEDLFFNIGFCSDFALYNNIMLLLASFF